VLVDVDCQLRDSTSVGGLHTFQIDEDPAKRPDPMDWPLLQMASDRGSDITCAIFFMKYEININLDDAGDQSHDIHNDQKGTLSDAKLLSFNLLQCAALNVHHGPWSEDTRFRQVVDGMKDLGQFESPASCPLFGAMARKMLRDTDEEHRIGDPDIEEMLWHRLFDESPWARKGRKIHHNKFLDALENTWMTSFFKGTRLMFKRKKDGAEWLFSLGEVPGSAASAWPAEEVQICEGKVGYKLATAVDLVKMRWIVLVDFDITHCS
jgi:hypothetical protein